MNARTTFKRIIVFVAVLVTVGLLAAFAAVSSARVVMTESGVHKQLSVPVVLGALGIRMYSATGEDVFIPGHLDGPVVRRNADGRWSASWFCEDRVHHATGDAAVLRIECAGVAHAFPLATAAPAPAVAPMPGKLVVLSDLEGNIRFLEAALRKLEIVDAAGDWSFGQGHLVVLGDSVDRGRDVFAVLWRLHGLAAQAHGAGGAVQVVLGNHEQYVLRGNSSRANPEHRYALQQMGGFAQSFAADTVIGAWLRQQPVMLKLGTVLFVHGGVSPQVVASGLSVAELNESMRNYWGMDVRNVAHTPALDAVLGRTGVTQYRGYFHGIDGFYPAATQADVDRMLAHFGAGQVVVAHTVVERIKRLYGDRVIAVDVNHDQARPEVLSFDRGVAHVIDIGVPRRLAASTQTQTQTREFSLLDEADRELVVSMYRGAQALSELPHPY